MWPTARGWPACGPWRTTGGWRSGSDRRDCCPRRAASSPPRPPCAARPERQTTVTDVTTAAAEPREPVEGKARRARGEQTRQLILETALRLFRERGYAETTMRAIAKEAGVAVGNAYYYFDSKEHLIQGFYDRNQAAHR